MSDLRKWIGRHPMFVAIMAVIYSYGGLVSILTPKISPGNLLVLEGSHTLLMLASTAIIYLAITGIYLIHKGRKYYSSRPLSQNIPLIWGLSFFAYIVTYIGIMLKALNAVEMTSAMFFFFRSFMILWAAGIVYGLISLRTGRKDLRRYIPAGVVLVSLAWFTWGLLVRGSVEYTMYGFTSFIWIPLTFAFGYFFWAYSGGTGHSGMKWISAGMVYMGATYFLWAPTHENFLYEMAFFHYNIAVSIILLGMTKLPWKEMSDVERPLDLIFEEDLED